MKAAVFTYQDLLCHLLVLIKIHACGLCGTAGGAKTLRR